MRASSFDFIGNLDTLLAVVIGAVLATGGALVAEIIQDRLGRKRRERDAARFFGELMTSIDSIIDLAIGSRAVGDPWGRVTHRLFETALREAAVYERNRERLFELGDMQLRFDIHAHVLRETVPLVAILEQTDTINDLDRQLADQTLDEAARWKLEAEHDKQVADRDLSLESTLYQRALTPKIIERLQKIARVTFDTDYRRPPEDAEDSEEANSTSSASNPNTSWLHTPRRAMQRGKGKS